MEPTESTVELTVEPTELTTEATGPPELESLPLGCGKAKLAPVNKVANIMTFMFFSLLWLN